MKRLAAFVAILLVCIFCGCYNQEDAAREANEFCRYHGGVAEVNYSSFKETALWICDDGEAEGGG